MTDNPSGIRPMEYQVLIAPEKVSEQTKGGLYIPQERQEKDQYAVTRGTVLDMSPVAFSFVENAEAVTPQIGDIVVFAKYQGFQVQGVDGEDYWLMSDKSILAAVG